IGKVTPGGVMTEYPVAPGTMFGITSGSDGNIWFTASQRNKIGRIPPSGVVSEYAVPTPDRSPGGITSGPDGNVWFTEENGSSIGRVNIAGTVVVPEYGTTGALLAGGAGLGMIALARRRQRSRVSWTV